MPVRKRLAVRIRVLICGTLSCAAVAAAAPTAVAAPETICNGELPFGSYDNVVVPPDATCSASGSTVKRNFAVGRGATLNGGDVIIGGNLVALGATNLRLFSFSVRGDVRVVDGGGVLVLQQSTVRGTIDVAGVNGFIAIINNESPGALGRLRVVDNVLQSADPTSTFGLNITANQIRKHAEVSRNTGQVVKVVSSNTVGGTLSCIANTPPFEGSFNTAAAFRGECRGF
jgi:hypothetical protein